MKTQIGAFTSIAFSSTAFMMSFFSCQTNRIFAKQKHGVRLSQYGYDGRRWRRRIGGRGRGAEGLPGNVDVALRHGPVG